MSDNGDGSPYRASGLVRLHVAAIRTSAFASQSRTVITTAITKGYSTPAPKPRPPHHEPAFTGQVLNEPCSPHSGHRESADFSYLGGRSVP
jgi:hypothetical protein